MSSTPPSLREHNSQKAIRRLRAGSKRADVRYLTFWGGRRYAAGRARGLPLPLRATSPVSPTQAHCGKAPMINAGTAMPPPPLRNAFLLSNRARPSRQALRCSPVAALHRVLAKRFFSGSAPSHAKCCLSRPHCIEGASEPGLAADRRNRGSISLPVSGCLLSPPPPSWGERPSTRSPQSRARLVVFVAATSKADRKVKSPSNQRFTDALQPPEGRCAVGSDQGGAAVPGCQIRRRLRFSYRQHSTKWFETANNSSNYACEEVARMRRAIGAAPPSASRARRALDRPARLPPIAPRLRSSSHASDLAS